MRSYAWLELQKIWYLLTDVRLVLLSSRKWMEKERALTELAAEGWEISGRTGGSGVAAEGGAEVHGTRWSASVH